MDDNKKDFDKVKDGSKPGGPGAPPPPPPLILPPLSLTLPLLVPAEPSTPPGDEKSIPETTFSFVDLIRLYHIAIGKPDKITPKKLLKGLGKKMLKHPDKEYGDYARGLYNQLKKDLE